MEVYFLNAASTLLSSLIVTVLAIKFCQKKRTKRIVFFVISLIGSSSGLLISSWFNINQLSRGLSFFLQFMFALLMAAILIAIFFSSQSFSGGKHNT